MVATEQTALVADIGGTNARFALVDRRTLEFRHRRVVLTRQEPSLEIALERWLRDVGERPREAALAVAGPVTGDRFVFTNSPWSFSRADLARRLGLDRLLVVNDFQALALSLPRLRDGDRVAIGDGKAEPGWAMAVVGAGTGLGVGGLVPVEDRWIAVPSEGGHVSIAPESEEEFAILTAIGLGAGHLSVERVVSGPGIATLHNVLARRAGRPAEALPSEEITRRALKGGDPIASAALDFFVTLYGRFAGDVALTLGARGGIYLGGGIAPGILPLLTSGRFRAAFDAKGRLSPFVSAIPVYVIVTPDAPLIGACAALA